jgi:alpha/beta superfamily hydrolase
MGHTEYLERCPSPKFFIQSTHDEFGPREQFEALYAHFAEPKRLVWVEAADHFFAGALDRLEEEVLRLDTLQTV